MKKVTPLYLCFIDITRAYDSVDQILLWNAVARFGVLPRTLTDIRQSHDGMQASVRLDDGKSPKNLDVGHSLGQGCVLEPLVFNLILTAVFCVAEERHFLSNAAITDNMVQPQRNEEKGEKGGKPRTGKVDS